MESQHFPLPANNLFTADYNRSLKNVYHEGLFLMSFDAKCDCHALKHILLCTLKMDCEVL